MEHQKLWIRWRRITHVSLGVPNWLSTLRTNKFSGAPAGDKEDFRNGSISLPIFFTLLLFYLVSLLYFCLHLFIQNTKN
jgi:hypothetical protein